MLDFANCGDVWVVKDRCIRSRFSKSHCRKCEDICIVDAIRFSPEVSFDTRLCFNCGLCYAACPFGAISVSGDDEKLLSIEGEEVEIGCVFAESKIKVACISRLTEDLLFGWFIDGKRVRINRGNCKKCRFSSTLSYFNKAIKKAILLSKAAGIKPDVKIKTKKADSVYIPKKSVSRRDLFSSFRLPGAIKAVKSRRKRDLLVDYLKKVELVSDPEYPDAASLEINSSCTLCGVCEHVCAADAILIVSSEEEGKIYFKPSSCINCLECEEACIYSALQFSQGRVSDLIKKPKKLFEASKKICSSCGKEFFATEEVELCSACRAREESKAQFLNFLKNL